MTRLVREREEQQCAVDNVRSQLVEDMLVLSRCVWVEGGRGPRSRWFVVMDWFCWLKRLVVGVGVGVIVGCEEDMQCYHLLQVIAVDFCCW